MFFMKYAIILWFIYIICYFSILLLGFQMIPWKTFHPWEIGILKKNSLIWEFMDGTFRPPRALPKYVPNKISLRRIAYQMVGKSITLALKNRSKKVWPIFLIKLVIYSLLDYQHAIVEAKSLEKIQLSCIAFNKHDPL